MRWLILFALGVSFSAGAQRAQFCSVSRFGVTNCHHLTLDSCQMSARAQGGQCLIGAQPSTPCKGINTGAGFCSDPMQAYREAQEMVRQAQQERAHQQERQRLQAQSVTERSNPQNVGAGGQNPRAVIYQCSNGGQIVVQDYPAVGCVVSEVRY